MGGGGSFLRGDLGCQDSAPCPAQGSAGSAGGGGQRECGVRRPGKSWGKEPLGNRLRRLRDRSGWPRPGQFAEGLRTRRDSGGHFHFEMGGVTPST